MLPISRTGSGNEGLANLFTWEEDNKLGNIRTTRLEFIDNNPYWDLIDLVE
jgi:hypothetical protein